MRKMRYLLLVLFQVFVLSFLSSCKNDDKSIPSGEKPVIVDFNPKEAYPGNIVTIVGEKFGSIRSKSDDHVFFGKVEVSEYISWSDKEIKVRVPENAETAKIDLCKGEIKVSSNEDFKFIPGAVIESVQPEVLMPGTTLTVKGKNFKNFIEKGLQANQIVFEFTSEKGFVTAEAKAIDEHSITVDIPFSAQSGVFYVNFGDYQKVKGLELQLQGDYKFDMSRYVEKGGTITIDENGQIGSTANQSYVIYEFDSPVTGKFDFYFLFGSERQYSFVNIGINEDLEKLRTGIMNAAGTVRTLPSGDWTPKDKYSVGPFYIQEGVHYYLKMTFINQNSPWVGNAHGLGYTVSTNQDKEAINIVDAINTYQGHEFFKLTFDGSSKDYLNDGVWGDKWADSPNYIVSNNGYGEFYFNQAALDKDPERRNLAGCEVTCTFKSKSEGWYGWRIYLPTGDFKKDYPNDASIIAQMFQLGRRNSWAGVFQIDGETFGLTYRHYLYPAPFNPIKKLNWDEWIPIVAYFKVGKNNKGEIKVWVGKDMTEGNPNYHAKNINFGYADEWEDDNTFKESVVWEGKVYQDRIGCKFGLYVHHDGDRKYRVDDITVLEGNPSGAFNFVCPPLN